MTSAVCIAGLPHVIFSAWAAVRSLGSRFQGVCALGWEKKLQLYLH